MEEKVWEGGESGMREGLNEFSSEFSECMGERQYNGALFHNARIASEAFWRHHLEQVRYRA